MDRITLIFFLILSFKTSALEASSSVSESKPLMNLLKVMTDIADAGPEMSFFGWSEDPSDLTDGDCKTAAADDAPLYLSGLLSSMDWASDVQSEIVKINKDDALKDFRRILGSGDFQRCDLSFSENMSFTRIYLYQNLTSGYRIQFTEGYED